MFFFIAKTLAWFERPADLLWLIVAMGCCLSWTVRWRKTGIAVTSLAMMLFGAAAFLPAYKWIASPLEDSYPRLEHLPDHVDGIIVLGGALDPIATIRRGTPVFGGDGERMTEFGRLAREHPNAKLIFTSGNGSLNLSPDHNETPAARLFLHEQGIDTAHVIFEDRSRDTYENVIFSKVIARPQQGEVWILITSAMHMRRAVGIFQKAGWPVIADPVAYRSSGENSYDLATNLMVVNAAAHEWMGLVAYKLTGRM